MLIGEGTFGADDALGDFWTVRLSVTQRSGISSQSARGRSSLFVAAFFSRLGT